MVLLVAANLKYSGMSRKRKRAKLAESDKSRPSKRLKNESSNPSANVLVDHPTLSRFYTRIVTLRTYLISKLPTSSRSRRRRITFAGRRLEHQALSIESPANTGYQLQNSGLCDKRQHCAADYHVSQLLDNVLVCVIQDPPKEEIESRQADIAVFSQNGDVTMEDTILGSTMSLSETIEFAIWRLFYRVYKHIRNPPHMLCQGYQRSNQPPKGDGIYCAAASIQKPVSTYPNSHVNTLRNEDWSDVFGMLGNDRERIMLDLIFCCSIFMQSSSTTNNVYQLSGKRSKKKQHTSYLLFKSRNSHDGSASVVTAEGFPQDI